MALNETVVESVASANFKAVGEQNATLTNLMFANQVAHQGRMNIVAEAAIGSIVKKLTEIDAAEAVSVLKATSGNEVASQLSALLAALNSGGQGVKAMGNTPPTTP